jgi:acyl-CoA thioesterase-1
MLGLALAALVGCSVEGSSGNPQTPDAPVDAMVPVPQSAASRDESGDPEIRMVFLGTSLTAGLGLRFAEDRWPERLGQIADSAGYAVTVVNAGVSGDTSAGGVRRLDWVIQDPIDVLVIELGANDGLRGQAPEELEANLTEIVERTRDAWPAVSIVIAGMEAPRNLGDDYTSRFRDVFTRVARRADAALIPFILEGVAADPSLNQADGIHPTAEGHDRMARVAWPVLDSVLASRSRSTS